MLTRFFLLFAMLFIATHAYSLTAEEAKAIAVGEGDTRIEALRASIAGADDKTAQFIQALADAGKAVIVISSELPEILGICDRIAVFHEGRCVKILDRAEATQEKIMYYAIGGQDE